jgi:hypothetical protein
MDTDTVTVVTKENTVGMIAVLLHVTVNITEVVMPVVLNQE